MTTSIAADPEYRRIDALPRRVWTPEQEQAAVVHYTQALRTHGGTQTLRPIQAVALAEASYMRGLLGAIYVGEGKTLLSALLPVVLGLTRPVLVIPAALIEKTREELIEYAKHWRLGVYLEIISYEMISGPKRAEMLMNLRPDGCIFDEVHRIKNPKAACTRRVARFYEGNPNCIFCGFSGSLITNQLKDFWHLSKWALKASSPLPTAKHIVDSWDQALSDVSFQTNPGVLSRWPIASSLPAPTSEISAARYAVQTRIVESVGFVKSKEGDGPKCSLLIQAKRLPATDVTKKLFKKLRCEWQTPCGWSFSEGVEMWRHARELALGFHYAWNPRPPEAWLEARRIWARVSRQLIERFKPIGGGVIDSEKNARDAVMRGECNQFKVKIQPSQEGLEPFDVYAPDALQGWHAIQHSYSPSQFIQWHDYSAINACIKWMQEKRGIVWTEHTAFGVALSHYSGVPFYAREGLDSKGNFIMRHPVGTPMIVSRPPNAMGRNLQAWNKALVTSMSSNPTINEQQIGRIHRQGQLADCVDIDILVTCREQYDSMIKAKSSSQYVQQMLGQTQRLLIADIVWPSLGSIEKEAINDHSMQRTVDVDFDVFE